MRYLGNKTKLLSFIDSVIKKYDIKGIYFTDLFAGTGSVGDYFKDRYIVTANDYMYFSKVIAGAKLLNADVPSFKRFVRIFGIDPFTYLNQKIYSPNEHYFVFSNYTPKAGRMYFTEDNAIKIDGMRLDIEDFYKNSIISYPEYLFLLASLLESVLGVSNTSGTYQAFFKFWEPRSTKSIQLEPLSFHRVRQLRGDAVLYCANANDLVRKISGDIVYIDPPYTTTQYTNSYHVLETIARYDYPELFGKTGRRVKRELSEYSNARRAIYEFEDLFRQLDFEHVLVSYSNQSIIPLEEMVSLARLFAVNGEVHVEKNKYREYATNNLSYKDDGGGLNEAIIYFRKERRVLKSPLNYSGSKDQVLRPIIRQLPKHVEVFVDAMGGAFNVGANVVACKKVVYNEYNPKVFEIVKMLLGPDKQKIVFEVKNVISKFGLHKKLKEPYLKFREYYNSGHQSALNLFTLQIYAFENIIRFNGNLDFNTPIGNNEYNPGTEERILGFVPRTKNVECLNKRYQELNIDSYPEDTIFYFDPPYFITKAGYNDGKRGFDGWNADREAELLNFLIQIDTKGYKFILSNVLTHNGKTHNMLVQWVREHDFRVTVIGKTGIKYPRTEVLITNY